jgi:hypothetical protein
MAVLKILRVLTLASGLQRQAFGLRREGHLSGFLAVRALGANRAPAAIQRLEVSLDMRFAMWPNALTPTPTGFALRTSHGVRSQLMVKRVKSNPVLIRACQLTSGRMGPSKSMAYSF